MNEDWDEQALTSHWALSFEETDLLKSKPPRTHLGFVAQLKYYQQNGTFPKSYKSVPDVAVKFLMDQLEKTSVDKYEWRGRTSMRHRSEILEYLGIQKSSKQDRERFRSWLISQVIPKIAEIKEITYLASEWFLKHKLELPTTKVLNRLIRSSLSEFEENLFTDMTNQLSDQSKEAINLLLAEPVEDDDIRFNELKTDPGRVGLETVIREIEKLNVINQVKFPVEILKKLNTKTLAQYRARIASQTVWETKRHPDNMRYALVTVFLFFRRSEIIDSLIELLIQIVHRLSVRAENKVKKALLKDFQKVYGKKQLLFRIASAAMDHPEDSIEDVIYPIASKTTLSNLVKEYKSSGPGYKFEVHKFIRASYGSHYRRMMPRILDALSFQSNNDVYRPVINALDYLKSTQSPYKTFFENDDDIPVEGVIPGKWLDVVIQADNPGQEKVNRINYEICVLQVLREKLRCKEIWVEGANKFRNPDEDLPQDFADKRDFYYQELGHSQDARQFTEQLKSQLMKSLTQLNASMPDNPKVKIRCTDKNRLCITPLDEQAEPRNINKLKGEIQAMWPATSLLDVLKEAGLLTGFTDVFETLRSSERLDRHELQKRLILILFGLGTNTGLKRMSAGPHGISYKSLNDTRNAYVTKDTLRKAIARVANATFEIRSPELWGGGTTACASDAKKFGSWDQNLMTEWHIRYGGRGVMIYWHVENKSTCIYSQLKRCSSSEVASMIEGVLRHCTDMSVDRNYVDTHGQSSVAFAFSHMLGFRLMPRLKNIARQKLYLPDTGLTSEFENLTPILSRNINWTLIREQYDQIIKFTAALKYGTAEPEAILRRFTKNNVKHPTYLALVELGLAVKTIFLCDYIENESTRREIHEGLNVVENWNSANSFIFFGKGGEVASNETAEQELSVLALHLLQNCLVYVNTLMIQRVAEQSHWHKVFTAEDYRALSPLIYAHINPYGIWNLDMEARIDFAA